MKLTTALLAAGSALGVALTGIIGYQVYDLSRFDNCMGYGNADDVEMCINYDDYQDQVRFYHWETMTTSKVNVRCTESTWNWDRDENAGTIYSPQQLSDWASDYCSARENNHR